MVDVNQHGEQIQEGEVVSDITQLFMFYDAWVFVCLYKQRGLLHPIQDLFLDVFEIKVAKTEDQARCD